MIPRFAGCWLWPFPIFLPTTFIHHLRLMETIAVRYYLLAASLLILPQLQPIVAAEIPPQSDSTIDVVRQAETVDVFWLPELTLTEVQNASLSNSLTNDRGILLGGCSDLWRSNDDPHGEFWIVTDRGPNGEVIVDGEKRRTFPVSNFTPLILRVQTRLNGSLILLEALPIVGQSGEPIGGLPNLAEYDSEAFDFAGVTPIEFNVNGIDSEGLVRTASGEFWVAEEYRPSILRIDPSGKVLNRYIPAGQTLPGADCQVADVLPSIYSRRRDNRGFEGLALCSDGRTLYAPMQSPLSNPSEEIGRHSRNCRILAFDLGTEQPSAEYLYRFDPVGEFDTNAEQKDMKIGAVAMIDHHRMLVLERTDAIAKVYMVDMNLATDLLSTRWHNASDDESLEALERPSSVGVRALPKKLVVDLSQLEDMPEKIEGLSIVDSHHIAVVNDDDFGFDDFDDEGNAVDSGNRTRLVLIRLAEPLR